MFALGCSSLLWLPVWILLLAATGLPARLNKGFFCSFGCFLTSVVRACRLIITPGLHKREAEFSRLVIDVCLKSKKFTKYLQHHAAAGYLLASEKQEGSAH